MRPGLKLYSVEERGEFWVNFFLLTLKTICSKYVGNASFFFVAFELVLKSKNTIYAPVEEMIIWKTNAWNHWLFPKTDWKLTTKFRSHTEESKHSVLLIPLKKGQNYFFPISRMHFKYSSQKNIDKNPTIETSKKKTTFWRETIGLMFHLKLMKIDLADLIFVHIVQALRMCFQDGHNAPLWTPGGC